MPRLSIVLAVDELQALADMAVREWREPRDQAGYLITQALRREGLLLETKNAPPETESAVPTDRRQLVVIA